jgi:hypothetical protein
VVISPGFLVDSWWIAATLVVGAFAIIPPNISWIQTICVYKTLISVRYKTLQRLEEDFYVEGRRYQQYLAPKLGETPIIRVETRIAR